MRRTADASLDATRDPKHNLGAVPIFAGMSDEDLLAKLLDVNLQRAW